MRGQYNMKITKKARHLLLFMVLGDGYIHNHNGYFSVRHSVKQQEYIEWKQRLLRKNGIKTTEVYFVSNNGYGSYEFRTYTHKFIKIMRKYIYSPKKDFANRKILNRLTPLGIYIWYLDDGSLLKIKNKDGAIKANILTLNTMLTKEQNQIIIDYFKEVWGVKFGQAKDHGKYRLQCGTKQARKFIAIIAKYKNEVKCMSYKFDVKPKPNYSV